MARLVAVCREGEEDYPFMSRQIPLYIDDGLTVSKVSHMYDQADVREDHRWERASSIIGHISSIDQNQRLSYHQAQTIIKMLKDRSLNVTLFIL